jgi:predicted TPR repeat methyltransferase
MGRYDEAARKYEKVLELNPQHMEARFKLAMILKKIQVRSRGTSFYGVIRAVVQHVTLFLFPGCATGAIG